MSLVDPIELTKALIRCRSVTPEEGGALTLLQSVLEPLGFQCHRMTFSQSGTADVENLYARLGTDAPNLCFAGHTDVVPPGDEAAWTHPPFDADVSDNILYGRGAVDMKGAVACFVAAVSSFLEARSNRFTGSISLLITGDEEADAINGTVKVLDWLNDRGETLDACLVGEPSNPKALGDEIKIGRRGSMNGELVVHGRQGHAAYPEKADNPIPKLARIVDHLTSVKLDDGTSHFAPSCLQVTILSVPNTAVNVIPAQARAMFNVRYNDHWTREKLESWLRHQCEKAAKQCDARLSLSFSGTGTVFLTEPGPLVATMVAAVMDVTGRSPHLTTGGGTSDARFIKDACPVIEFGLVNETIHKVDEHVPLNDLRGLTAIYQSFLENYFSNAA